MFEVGSRKNSNMAVREEGEVLSLGKGKGKEESKGGSCGRSGQTLTAWVVEGKVPERGGSDEG